MTGSHAERSRPLLRLTCALAFPLNRTQHRGLEDLEMRWEGGDASLFVCFIPLPGGENVIL